MITPVFNVNGAETDVRPVPATPDAVTPPGSETVTSKLRFPTTLGVDGLVTEKLGEPPLQMVGALLTATATGIGSTNTLTVCVAPFVQPNNFGVTV